jgi:hypothetical protein
LVALLLEVSWWIARIVEAAEDEGMDYAEVARNAIIMGSVMVDEIRLRPRARPLDEAGQ